MSRWVKQQYEGALAFLFIAIATVLPWSISFSNVAVLDSEIIRVRWWFGHYQYVSQGGPTLNWWEWVPETVQRTHGSGIVAEFTNTLGFTLYPGYVLWGVAAVVFLSAIGLGFALFVYEERVCNRFQIRYLSGGLLLGTGIIATLSTVWLWRHGLPGKYLPIGATFNIVFGTVLLTNQFRVNESSDPSHPKGNGPSDETASPDRS